MEDRRQDKRLFCADLVEVQWTEAGCERRRVANLEDISHSGVCLLMDCQLPPDTEVTVRCRTDIFHGFVRHAKETVAGFLIGLGFSGGSRWSIDGYRPEHLLDPTEIRAAEASRTTAS